MLRYAGTIAVIAGLVASAWGAYSASKAVWLTEEEAVEIAATRSVGDTFEEKLKAHGVQSLLRESRGAARGFTLIMIGTLLQAVGAVLLMVA
ncbi:MAG: hypothetical protein WA884_03765 [Methyloceanibacter sp.]